MSNLLALPENKSDRALVRELCRVHLKESPYTASPPNRAQLETTASEILRSRSLPAEYLGWTMVVLASEMWREYVASIPFERRLFLIPRCARHGSNGNPGNGGACGLGQWSELARSLGYRVAIAESESDVVKAMISGNVEAIIGAASLNLLEVAFDRLLPAGVPCMAIPLSSNHCGSAWDDDCIEEMIRCRTASSAATLHGYVHLWRLATEMFRSDELARLVPPRYGPSDPAWNGQRHHPLAVTEAIAYEFLSKGGKYSRPFIALAVYDAVSGGLLASGKDNTSSQSLPDPIKRVAISIETFHKASLVHDDIEDDDAFRYGEPTLHRRFGIPTAINVGDYLIGLGYRLASQESAVLGAETVADIVSHLANAHLRLSEGQGAELMWRDAHDKRLTPEDALRIYALKTAPAFEAALYMGLRMGGVPAAKTTIAKDFAHEVGVAFQILNDLQDWHEGTGNKGMPGGDVLGGRPTVLWALALEGLPPARREELIRLSGSADPTNLERIHRLYRDADVFSRAKRLVERHRDEAARIAAGIEPEELRSLLYYLMDRVLEGRREAADPRCAESVPA